MKIADKKMTRQPFVLDTVNHARNIANINRRTVGAALDDDIAVALGRLDLAVRPEGDRLVFAVELAGAGIGSGGANGSRQIVEGHVARGQFARDRP